METLPLPCFVGIDVSKARLDVPLRPLAESFPIAHEADAIASLVERLQAVSPQRIVLEATGG